MRSAITTFVLKKIIFQVKLEFCTIKQVMDVVIQLTPNKWYGFMDSIEQINFSHQRWRELNPGNFPTGQGPLCKR